MRIMISAGEVSGDLHGSQLLAHLKESLPAAEFLGIGGERLREAGMELLYHTDQMSIVGFVEVLRHLPFLRKVFRDCRKIFKNQRPDLLILIDYPGFNLRLAKMAKKYSIPVLYYIIPQIWAWGAGRIKALASFTDHAAVIFPFEHELLKNAGIKSSFVGHPLLDFLKPSYPRDIFFKNIGLNPALKTVGLLPGSRISEVQGLLPTMIQIAKALKQRHPDLQIIIGKADNLNDEISQALKKADDSFHVVERATYDVMKHADVLMVASGTATLEAALLGTPMILAYHTSPITYFIARQLIKVDHIGLPNIVVGQEIVPEFIQDQFRVSTVLPVLETFLFDERVNAQKRGELVGLQCKMGQPGAARRTAQIALEILQTPNNRRLSTAVDCADNSNPNEMILT